MMTLSICINSTGGGGLMMQRRGNKSGIYPYDVFLTQVDNIEEAFFEIRRFYEVNDCETHETTVWKHCSVWESPPPDEQSLIDDNCTVVTFEKHIYFVVRNKTKPLYDDVPQNNLQWGTSSDWLRDAYAKRVSSCITYVHGFEHNYNPKINDAVKVYREDLLNRRAGSSCH